MYKITKCSCMHTSQQSQHPSSLLSTCNISTQVTIILMVITHTRVVPYSQNNYFKG